MTEITGTPSGRGRRFAVLASRFNEVITQRLVDGALDALVKHGAAYDDVDLVWVPGAWELPGAARRLLVTERYDALVAVGAAGRGGADAGGHAAPPRVVIHEAVKLAERFGSQQSARFVNGVLDALARRMG